jgi:hypothetical protein
MRVKTTLELTARPLERVESDVAVAGFFTDERPLRGGAARVDWRLCGGLSKRIVKGDLSGKSGEALLMGCGRALRSPRLLVLGLGDRGDFDLLRFADETAEAMRRCVDLRCPQIALTPLGVSPDDVPRHAASLVAGIRDAFEAAVAPMRIHLCIQQAEIAGVERALQEACKAARADEIELLAPASRLAPASSARAAFSGAPVRG